MTPTDDERDWRAVCVAVGDRPLDTDVIGDALHGPFDAAALAGLQLALPYAGANGMRHFHPGCPPLDQRKVACANPSWTRLALGELDQLVASRRHHCVQDIEAWLPEPVRAELALFADAHLLLAPWLAAVERSTRHGRPCLPRDNGALRSGLVAELIAAARQHASEHPDRGHVERLAARLVELHGAWSDLLARAHEVAAADPHSEVLRWQAARGLPALQGSHRQVRWAERIRFDVSGQPDAQLLVGHETDARVWIGLHEQGTVEDQGWARMQMRIRERQTHRDRVRPAW